MNLRDALNLKKISGELKKGPIKRPNISFSSLTRSTLLIMILVIAVGIRLLPLQWGFYLSEFDPYYQYRQAKYIVDNGIFGWLNWHNYMSWYPGGNIVPQTSYPGLALAAVGLHTILNALGIHLVFQPSFDPLLSDPLYNLCVIFPIIMSAATCLVIYFLGKDLGGESAGLFAALFLALDSSYIGRTSLGWFDDETVGIFSLLLVTLFFMRALNSGRTQKTSVSYALGAGLFLGYLCASWGASRYAIVMLALFAFVLLVMKRYSPRLLLTYAITFGLALSMTMAVPYLNGRRFLLETDILPVYGVFFLLCIAEINRRAKTPSRKMLYISGVIVLVATGVLLLWSQGYLRSLEAKFLSVLNPYERFTIPLIESVAEHRPSAWGTFYYNFGVGIFFVPIGLFFAIMMATNLSIFMVIYCLTGVYFASSMIRLNIVLAPALCLLWALALTRLMKPFILLLKEKSQVATRKKRFVPTLSKELIGGVLIVMFLLFALTYVIGTDFPAGPDAGGPRVFSQASSPTTLAASSMPITPSTAPSDWLKALTWMREKLPPPPTQPGEAGTVIACWWDYGYWITMIGNKTTIADNGTINSTQIRQIATMFMSPEDEAIQILKKYNVTHVVVFTTVHYYGYDQIWGEVGKFKWMIKIAGLNETTFGNDAQAGQYCSYYTGQSYYWSWSSEGQNTTLYKMITCGKSLLGITLVDGADNEISPIYYLDHFNLVYPESAPTLVNGYYALVLVYEVEY